MQRYINTLFLSLLIVSLHSCRLEDRIDERQISLEAFIAGSDGKPARLEEGDSLGLFITGPTEYSNILMTVDASGSLSCEGRKPEWLKRQKEASNFRAYMPYDPAWTKPGTFTYKVRTDQSGDHGFSNSILRYCRTSAKRGSGAVKLEMEQLTSELEFDFSGSAAISSIIVNDVPDQMRVNLATGAIETLGSRGSMTAHKVGENRYKVICAPGKCRPSVTVLLMDGSQRPFTLQEDIETVKGSTTMYSSDPLDLDKGIEWNSIAALCKSAGSETTEFDDFFLNVTATCVSGKYVHLEDKSGAILLYCEGHGLETGMVLSGKLKGTLTIYHGMPEITSLKHDEAEHEFTSTLPLKTMTLKELDSAYEENLSRRIQLGGVTVTDGISTGSTSNRTGSITQNGSSITIYNRSGSAELAAGLTGDLICYPSLYDGSRQLAIYDASQFQESFEGKEDNAFTRTETPGIYDISDMDSPRPLSICGKSDQYAAGSGRAYRYLRIQNLAQGRMIEIRLDTRDPQAGSETEISVSSAGDTFDGNGRFKAVICNKNSRMIWMRDVSSQTGFIIPTE